MHPCGPGLSSVGELSDIATVVNEEAQLSAHIRHLLLDYVRRYITTDYLQYTQSAVAELVSLEPVPTHDPASLTLPTDPFTTLISLFKLGDLPSYQEKLVISQAARLLLREVITLPKGKPRSERLVWSRDAWDEREDESFYPVEPILTRRAVRETPILGKTGGAHRCRETEQVKVNSYTSLVTSTPLALDSVNVQPIQEPDVNLDKVLDVTFHLKASEHAAVRALLKSASTMSRPQALPHNAHMNDYRRRYLPASFDFDQPRPTTPRPDSPPLLPIFARNASIHREKSSTELRNAPKDVGRQVLCSMEEIPGYIGASRMTLPGGNDDSLQGSPKSLSRENMVIVDGWQTYATSSPSTVCSLDDDEVDELKDMFPSSPNTDVSGPLNLVRDVEDSKLEEVQIPRNRRIGGNLGQSMRSTVDKALKAGGLGPFLAPLLGPSIPSSKDSQTQDLHPLLREKLASTLVQAPSEVDSSSEKSAGQALGKVQTAKEVQIQEADVDSMCGQASISSNVAPQVTTATKKDEENTEIRGIYLDVSGPKETRLGPQLPRTCVDPMALIRDERLFDDKEGVEGKGDEKADAEQKLDLRLMHVPVLPAPNIGAKLRVRGYGEYLVEPHNAPKAMKCEVSPPILQFLKGVKGVSSLRVALSWIPFTRTNPIPPHAGILGNDLFQEKDGEEDLEREVHALFAKACVVSDPDHEVEGQPRGCGFDDERRWRGAPSRNGDSIVVEGYQGFSPEVAKCEIILTRPERRALLAREAGTVVVEQEEKEDGVEDGSGETQIDERSNEDLPKILGKATRAHEDGYRPAKRARLSFEDSGIGMMLDPPLQAGELLDFDCYPNTMLDNSSLGNDDSNDMLTAESFHGGLHDHDKENDPPARLMKRTDHDVFYEDTFDASRPGLLDPDAMITEEASPFGKELEEWKCDDDDDHGGSFEPLSLSYDSQPYRAFSSRQTHGTQYAGSEWEHEMHQGQQEQRLCASADMVQEQHNQDWPQSRRVLGDILVPADGDYSSTINTDTNDSDMFTTKDRRQTIEREGSSGDEIKNLNLDLTRHTLALAAFAELRAKRIISGVDPPPSPDLHKQAEELDRSSPPECKQKQGSNEATAPRTTPQELYDRRTLRVPISWEPPVTVHKYMASLDLLQKQVLVKSLAAQECLVELVERDSLNGADLIIDPHTAVIFTPLLSLPALHKKLLAMLSVQTWRYKHILVVFEAYPVSRSYRTASHVRQKQGLSGPEPELYAYTPPIMKAIKRFRRDLNIAEGCGKKAAACDVWCAFADSVAEAATCARLFGDEAQRADCSGGALWGGREWLDDDVSEDEENLASLQGMNRFSALVVLCQMTLQEFLDLSAEQRTATIGPFIGPEATNMLNADIEQRMRTMESSGPDISQYEDVDIHESTELSLGGLTHDWDARCLHIVWTRPRWWDDIIDLTCYLCIVEVG